MSRRVTLNLGFQGNTRDVTVVIPDDEPTPWQWGDRLSVVGKPTPRVDGPLKATGAAHYTYDIELPGMLYGAILRSPWPHARIRDIDLSAAQNLAGVRAVLALDDREIRFAGQEVAAVAAISSDIAADALKLIKVDYETLPFVVDMDAARQGFRAARLRQSIQRRQDQEFERRRRAEGTRDRGEHDRGDLHDAGADSCLPRNAWRGRELQRGGRPAHSLVLDAGHLFRARRSGRLFQPAAGQRARRLRISRRRLRIEIRRDSRNDRCVASWPRRPACR